MVLAMLDNIAIEGRKQQFLNRTIEHPRFCQSLQRLERQFVTCDVRRIKLLHLLIGWTGAGKTTLIEEFHRRHPDTETAFGVQKPIILATLPNKATERGVVVAILKAMGYALNGRYNKDDIADEIAEKAQLLGTKMIIVDEAQHLMRGKVVDNANFLKSLRQRLSCELVLSGLPELENLKFVDAQLTRRNNPVSNLSQYSLTDGKERRQFLEILNRTELALGLPAPSELATPDLARRIYAASDGLIGIVSKLLSEALELALELGADRINKGLLAQVFARDFDRTCSPEYDLDELVSLADVFKIDDLEQSSPSDLERSWVEVDETTNPFACSIKLLDKIHATQRRVLRASGDRPRYDRGFQIKA